MQTPRHSHLVLVQCILCYLKSTSNHKLLSPLRFFYTSQVFVMQIRLVILILDFQLLVDVCFLVILLFFGRVRSMIESLNPQVSLNIMLCLSHSLRVFDFGVSWINLVFFGLLLLSFMLITSVLFKILQIQSFMRS